MTALEAAVRSYWRNSRALFAGSEVARARLRETEQAFKPDVAKLSMAATSSLMAAEMRAR